MSKSTTLRTFIAAALVTAGGHLGLIDCALGDTPKSVAVESGDLADALESLAKQFGVDVIYPSSQVKGLKTSGVKGVIGTRAAFEKLVEGTPLVVKEKGNSVLIALPPQAKRDTAEVRDERRPLAGGEIRLAQADTAAAPPAGPAAPEEGGQAQIAEISQVVVTGTRLRRAEIEGPQPVLMLTREEIERSGQSSIGELLRTLPEASGGVQVQSSFGQNPQAQTVQLRGLPTGRTLVLVNGRRLPASGAVDGGFSNLNNIPAAAVERIDVLPHGASAIYGSDALAGVINIVLRRDVDGAQLNAKLGSADGSRERGASMVWGAASERASISLSADYYDRTALLADERDRLNDVDFRRHGWRDQRGTTCNPGTVYSATGGNLPGVGAPSAAIPSGLTGTPAIADFAAGAGQANRCYIGGMTLAYPTDRLSFLGTADWRIGETLTLFAEASSSRLHHEFFAPYTLSRVLVPATNPFNPFGVNVRVDYRFSAEDLGYAVSSVDSRLTRVLAGVRGDIGADWDWELTGWGGKEHVWQATRAPNQAYVPSALAATDPANALNLFTSGPAGSRAVLDAYLQSPNAVRLLERDATTETKGATLLFRGTVLRLPAGPLSVAVGGELIQEDFENAGIRGLFEIDRDDKAAFAEVRVPLLARRESGARDAELLALSAAVRRDDYSDFGTATTPQFGVELRPTRSLLLRGAYAEAFRAPDLFAVYGPSTTGPLAPPIFTDPLRNGQIVNPATFVAGGNPELKPEEGRSYSAGLVWSSQRWQGLNLSLNWWQIEMTDRINVFPNPQLVINSESLLSGRITRAAPGTDGLPGRITQVDYSALNLGDVWVEGVDYGVETRFETRYGTWSPSLRATQYLRYDSRLDPRVGVVSNLGRAGVDLWVPRWRGTAGLNWRRGTWSAGLTGRYVGHYRDYNPLLDGSYLQLGDFWVFDTNVRWNFGRHFAPGSLVQPGSYVSAGVVDLFDHEPEFSATTSPGYGWDGAQNDIRGRYFYMEAGLKF